MMRPYGGKGAELAKVAPDFNQYTQSVLYDDLWERGGLSQRDRSMITIAALIAMHRPDQMIGHMQTGLENGITREELGEMITHLAFYTSWPNAGIAARKLLQLTQQLDAVSGG
ncbi:carboxymuconolactone decarboxylase family protein [Sphingomonas soli]|uniref:carboxymuconolactone decarboxylase family protein n=1 Tax=Sphingomonas soli TaxID=266127 RepID=UPI00082E06A0|nr:carboxymuconolactone decarboxylase family protein [Sphingomonas soli]